MLHFGRFRSWGGSLALISLKMTDFVSKKRAVEYLLSVPSPAIKINETETASRPRCQARRVPATALKRNFRLCERASH